MGSADEKRTGGGGGGKGKSTGGGSSTGGSSFSASEEQGINNTVEKLRAAPADVREAQLRRADQMTRGNMQEALTKRDKLEDTMKQYEQRNPGSKRENHPLYKDYVTAQERYATAQKDFQKFKEVQKRLA